MWRIKACFKKMKKGTRILLPAFLIMALISGIVLGSRAVISKRGSSQCSR